MKLKHAWSAAWNFVRAASHCSQLASATQIFPPSHATLAKKINLETSPVLTNLRIFFQRRLISQIFEIIYKNANYTALLSALILNDIFTH